MTKNVSRPAARARRVTAPLWMAVAGALIATAGDATAQSRCIPLSTRTVGWWPFDETSGPVTADLARTPQNGSHVNGPRVVAGRVGRALEFDGTSYVEIDSDPEIQFGTGDFSFNAWVWLGDAESFGSLIDKRSFVGAEVRGYHVFVQNGNLAIQLADGGYDNFHAGVQLPGQQWFHVAITVDRDDPAGIRFYLNGVRVGNDGDASLHPGDLDAYAPLRIGGHSMVRTFGVAGRMDEVELHVGVLSPAQISKLYNAGATGRCRF